MIQGLIQTLSTNVVRSHPLHWLIIPEPPVSTRRVVSVCDPGCLCMERREHSLYR